MKLIVAGSRTFNDHTLLKKYLDAIHHKYGIEEVISGMARGADLLGRRWALESGVLVREMPADWDRYGKRAGYIRNEEMAGAGSHLLCFWDGVSRGTKHMIDIARIKGMETNVVLF